MTTQTPNADHLPWWARYLLGSGIIWLLFEMTDKPNWSGWVTLAFLVFAGLLMYEILCAVVIGGIVYMIFGAVAALPTSAALIIGALIIANSNKS